MRCARWLLAAALLAGCSPPSAGPPREVNFAEFGYRMTVPTGWAVIADEVESRFGSHFSLKTADLDGAKKEFLAELPESILPNLVGWTKHSFVNVNQIAKESDKIDGQPALRVTYTAAARDGAATTTVRYWVIRREQFIYIWRAVFPPGRLEKDTETVDAMVHSIRMIPLHPEQAEQAATPVQIK